MSGTKSGGQKAAKTTKKKHGKDFYKKIGQKGGSSPKTQPSGFALWDRKDLQEMGRRTQRGESK